MIPESLAICQVYRDLPDWKMALVQAQTSN